MERRPRFWFVTPNGGGQKAFVHIKAFSNNFSRPIDGDLITYELTTDENRRFCAKNIRFVGERVSSSVPNKISSFTSGFAILFCVSLTMLTLVGLLPLVVIEVYLAASAVTYLAYVIDKSAAQNNRWRTKESTLHLFSWPGAGLVHYSRKKHCAINQKK